MRWFRWHLGSCEDGKFRAIARNANVTVATVIGVWASLLEDASHVDHRGIVARGHLFHAAVLDLELEVLEAISRQMAAHHLVSSIDGNLHITNWDKRQFETDLSDATNAERQRRWRERHHKTPGKHHRNGLVTAAKRPDTDTDTDTEKNKCAVATATDAHFIEFKRAYPKRKGSQGWPPARKHFDAAVKSGTNPALLIGAARKFAAAQPPENIGSSFIPMAETWLRKRQWEEFVQSNDDAGPPANLTPEQRRDWIRKQMEEDDENASAVG